MGNCFVASRSLVSVAVYNVGGFNGATNVSFVVVIISDAGDFTGSVKYCGRLAVVGTKSFGVVVRCVGILITLGTSTVKGVITNVVINDCVRVFET